jgi:hypothetical protein|tara:strand:+ start:2472 stop:3590 length:1119 start_codon:yes stop_codon:yes gene_type:complete
MVEVLEQRTRQPEYIEKRAEQLLTSVYGDPTAERRKDAEGNFIETEEDFNLRKFGRAGISQAIPGYEFAGFTPEQQQAFQLASSGIGSYAPYLQQAQQQAGLGATTQAIGAGTMAQASPYFQAGAQAMQGGAQAYDPTSAQAFMDPYQTNVTQEALKEYERQADIARTGLATSAQKAGAFGGSRMGVQEAELDRNLADIKSRRVFEDMSRNYQQAQGAAMGSFSDQQKRQLASGQGLGQLGQGLGQLGQGFGQLGLGQASVAKTQAGLGALGQQLGQADIQSLLGIGGMQQQLGQAQMEANRQQQLMAQREPYTRLGFASDILRGAPSGQIQYTQQPQTNPYAQALGLGIAGLGAMGQYGQAFPDSRIGSFF